MKLRKITGSSKDKFSLRDFSTAPCPCISLRTLYEEWRQKHFGMEMGETSKMFHVKWTCKMGNLGETRNIVYTVFVYMCVYTKWCKKNWWYGFTSPLFFLKSFYEKQYSWNNLCVCIFQDRELLIKKLNVYVYICLPVCMCTVCMKGPVQSSMKRARALEPRTEVNMPFSATQSRCWVLSFEGASCALTTETLLQNLANKINKNYK